jgi:hypothetical protein
MARFRDPIVRSHLLFLALLTAAVAFMVGLGNCVQEDAFISFRYAANLVDGLGLVYNPGERVEGYSNFLWTVLMAGGMALGADPVPLSRFAGLAFATILIALVYRVAWQEDRSRGVTHGLVAAAFVAASPSIATEGVQGLETVFFALLVTAGTLLGIESRRTDTGTRLAVMSGLVLALASMTRPEGLGVLGLLLAGSCAFQISRRRFAPHRSDLVTSAAFVALFAPYWLWRFAYYGYPFPNTFYAKTGGGWRHVLRGLEYLRDFALGNPVLIVTTLACIVAVILTLSRRRDDPPRADPFDLVAGTLLVGYLGYVAIVGGDFKATFRFVIPVLPLWALWLDRRLSLGLAGRSIRARRAVVGLLLAAIVAGGAVQVRPSLRWAADRTWDLERRTAAGLWLRAHARPGETLAIHSAGIIPYYSGLYTIDMWGLNDLHIGHREMPAMGSGLAGHEKTDPVYVFDREPTYYVDEYAYVTPRPYEGLRDLVLRQFSLPAIRNHYRERRARVYVRAGGERSNEWFVFLERHEE